MPRHDLLPLNRYQAPFMGRRYANILIGRGCPFPCTFCVESILWNKRVRLRSVTNVVKEMQYLASLDVKNIHLMAELVTVKRSYMLDLCNRIVSEGLKVRWTCNSRVDTLDEEMLRAMKKAGCFLIAFGIESGDQDILNRAQKKTTIDQIEKTITLTHHLGIKAWGYFIIGLPGETEETALRTIDLAKRLPFSMALFHVATPYAGTPFYFEAKQNNWLISDDWQAFDMDENVNISYPNLPAEKIEKLVKQAFRQYYLRPIAIWRMLRMIQGPWDLWELGRIALNQARWMIFKKN